MTQLLTAAAAGVTGTAVNVENLLGDMRVTAIGGFSVQPVTVQYSPTADSNDWIDLFTLADDATNTIDFPVTRIRAKTVAGMVGTATAILMTQN